MINFSQIIAEKLANNSEQLKNLISQKMQALALELVIVAFH